MAHKPIPKKELDELLRLTRKYIASSDGDFLPAAILTAKRIEAACGIGWSHIHDMAYALLARGGFMPGASNEEVCDVLRLIGWEVTDDAGD